MDVIGLLSNVVYLSKKKMGLVQKSRCGEGQFVIVC